MSELPKDPYLLKEHYVKQFALAGRHIGIAITNGHHQLVKEIVAEQIMSCPQPFTDSVIIAVEQYPAFAEIFWPGDYHSVAISAGFLGFSKEGVYYPTETGKLVYECIKHLQQAKVTPQANPPVDQVY